MLEQSVSNPSIWAAVNSWFTPTVLFVLLNLMIGTILFSSNLSTTPQHQQQENQQHKQEKEQDHQESNTTNTQQHQQQNDQNTPTLLKSPSVLQRIKSINFKSFTEALDSDTTEHHILNHELQSAIDTQTHYLFDDHQTMTAQPQFSFQQAHQESSPLTESQPQIQIQQPHQDESTDVVPQSLDEVYSHFEKLTDSHFSRTTSDTKPASGEVPAKLSAKMKKSASMKSPFAHFEETDIVEARRPVTVRERGAKVTDVDEEVDAKADDFINKFKQQLKLQRIDSIMRYKEVINRGAK